MRVTRHSLLFAAASIGALALGCSNGSTPQPVPANSPVTITTATPYAQPPQPTIVNSSGLTAGASPTPTTRDVTYKMEAGDTLLALASRFGSSVEAIMKRNNLSSPTELKIGQEIVIPTNSTVLATTTPTATATPSAPPTATATVRATATATSVATATATASPPTVLTVYTVQKGDNSFDIAGKLGVSVEDLAAANGKTVAQLAAIQIGDQLNIPRPR
ncbi:MAG: LysM peptidoglycan-binding domain-containing protein [Chloroflexi bacterium]|nr:MAG: LysM peptidoglycan-binding domain-containing protein [Chloroflexota bacterium]